jgi:Mn-dependent DtxR family transcriptional regulator
MKTESSTNAIAKSLNVDWLTVKTIIRRLDIFKERLGLSG